MDISQRRGLWAGLGGAVALLVLLLLDVAVTASETTTPQHAAPWPAQPVKIVVTFPPGGGTDLLARKLGERLAARIQQPVLVENRPGASGNIGARAVAESAPDGYTLLMVNSSFAVNPAVFHDLPFSPRDDFVAVINVALVPSVLVVPVAGSAAVSTTSSTASSSPATLADWLAAGEVNAPQPYASCGNGTPQHMAGEMLARAAARPLQQVPYKGCGPALAAVAGGQVGAAIVTASAATALIQAGQVRALAVTSKQRSPLLPEVPAISELGWPDYDLDQWHGLLAPAGTSPEVVARLNAELAAVVADPAMQTALRALGFNPITSTPQAFQDTIAADLARFAELAARVGLRLD